MASRISNLAARLNPVRIDSRGQPQGTAAAQDEIAVYFGNIQAAGARQPLTGLPGLGLLPGILVDGRQIGFQDFFARHRNDAALQAALCIYMEADSGLLWDGKALTAVGEGAVVVMRSRADRAPDAADIAQYRNGESFSA